jgi:hypothetical protein
VVWTLAATLVAAVGVGLVAVRRDAAEPRLRTSAPVPERPRPLPVAPAAGSSALELRFESNATSSHRIVLFDAEGIEIWRSAPTRARTVALPTAVLREPGTYLWQVCVLPEGAENEAPLARSAIGRFEWPP